MKTTTFGKTQKDKMNLRTLLLSVILTLGALYFQSCTPSETTDQEVESVEEPQESTEAPASTSTENEANESAQETSEPVNSLESNIQFIRDKYAIIMESTPAKIDSMVVDCSGGNARLERHYNEQNELYYLQYEICSDHGCSTTHHYFWEEKLIFQFYQNSYWVGRSDQMTEHRTYVKDEQMIRCLEKEVSTTEGYAKLEELVAQTANQEVDCTPDKMTNDLPRLMTLTAAEAEDYLCN